MPFVMMDLVGAIDAQLHAAQSAFNELPMSTEKSQRLAWLERQLAHVISQLQALKDDAECGWVTPGDGDVEEMLNDFTVLIANLKGLIQTAKLVTR